jgi:acyl carrier protein
MADFIHNLKKYVIIQTHKHKKERNMLDKVIAVVVEQLDCDAAEVKEDSKFIEDLGADSLDVVELVMALEEEFDIEIPDEDAEGILTVKDALNYIENHK